jgi:hypothetical protein
MQMKRSAFVVCKVIGSAGDLVAGSFVE